MIGISFSGGGVRGSYQIGAYYAFKKCHIKVDGFVGTSIGSFNALMLACKKDEELLEFWQNVEVGKLLGFNDEFIKAVNEKNKSTNLVIQFLKNAKDIVLNKGISTTRFRECLEKLDLEDELKKTNKDFGLITVRVNDLKPLYKFKDDIPQGKLNDYILASCYLPVFKREKIIDEAYYLDGGFYDNSPANMLLDKGYDKVYVIDLSAIGVKRRLKDKDKVTIIKPSRNLGSIFTVNKSEIKGNIDLGYYDTLKVLKNLDGFDFIFKVKSEFFYNLLIRNIDKKLIFEMETLFRTTDTKELIINALEHIMKREKYLYTTVYSPFKEIKKIRKKYTKPYGVYKFICELRIF
ncbi:MAG: patatin-like phospholipase family protein [Bacilli bacterium]